MIFYTEMEISADTSVYISIGTIVAMGVFLWKLSSEISRYKSEIVSLKERVDEYDKMDIKTSLKEIQVDLKRIKAKMMEN